MLTDNGSCYRAVVHALACRALGVRHLRTRPYRPRTNGKAERFIRTLIDGWAYGAVYRTSSERTAALAGWLDWYKPPQTPPLTRTHPTTHQARRDEQRCWDQHLAGYRRSSASRTPNPTRTTPVTPSTSRRTRGRRRKSAAFATPRL